MKKLLIIDNKFFKRLINLEYFINAFTTNLRSDNYKSLFGQDSKIIYINNNDPQYDDKYKVNDNIEIKNSLSEVNMNEYDLVMYANIPFFVMNNMIFSQLENQKFDSNKIYSNEGYNLFFKNVSDKKRFIYSKAKVSQICNISNLMVYIFKPENLTVNSQEELLKILHKKSPQVIIEFINTGAFDNSNLFMNEDEYVNMCFDNLDAVETHGNYILSYSAETATFKKDDFYKFVESLMNNNTAINLEIKSSLDITNYFTEQLEEDAGGELKITTPCNLDISRLNISTKDSFYYDSGIVNGIIDLDDMAVRYFVGASNTKYYKYYNSNYKLLYKASKLDLQTANSIAIKRTMGMGDAILALAFAYKIYKQYNKKVNFYSSYDFRKYLIEDFINYYYIDGSNIYKDNTNGEDVFLDFDLAYEHLSDSSKPSFYDCYKQLFEDDTLDFEKRDEIIFKTPSTTDNLVVCNWEGSGWLGKEIDMGLADSISKYMIDKNYTVAELGRNRLSHYAQKTNPEESLDVLFDTIASSKFYIGCDSGQAHIAIMSGKPSFIFGGAISPMKSMYNTALVYEMGNTQLLCYSCRSAFNGTRTSSDGNSQTFVPQCFSEQQYQCMKFEKDNVIENIDNFLLKYE